MQQNPSYNPSFAPSAPTPSDVSTAFSLNFDDGAAREFLNMNHWPNGLQETLLNNLRKIPIRFFICDDSGSMSTGDGKRIVTDGKVYKQVQCTRWAELTTTLKFHANLAHASGAVSEFRMLNGAPPLVIGDRIRDPTGANFRTFNDVLNGSPQGGTPLCRHIAEVIAQIRALAPQLRAQGQRAVVVIATDGESSDGNVADALKPLKDLPAWVVIRLCTDEERIVEYWNSIDNVLELDMDVLDDLTGEAQEIHAVNPWLTYAEPMHRLREFGIPLKEIDLLDERPLSLDQLRTFVTLLFGGKPDDYPHPDINFHAFTTAVQRSADLQGKVYSPVHKSMRNWIEVKAIKDPNASGCSIC